MGGNISESAGYELVAPGIKNPYDAASEGLVKAIEEARRGG